MKVLITADIHLGNYSEFNFTAHSRLAQFDLLADRLLELKSENDCEEIWILGDFLRVPNSKQRVNNRLRRFIQKLCSNTSKVRFILGNHDTESKSSTQELDDSVLGMTSIIPNFIYEDHHIEHFDGHTFAFMNWYPEQNLQWIENKVNVMLGHYTKSNLFGQDIDESKFDLMIHGDIHNDQVIGKFVSVGTPIQHDMSSQENGTCVILDTALLEWKHIDVDADHTRFLRIAYTEDRSKEGFHGPLQYYIYRPKLGLVNSVGTEDVKEITWTEIDELINELALQKSLLDIHSEVLTKCVPYSEVDFNFQLKHVKIHGFRSIVDFEMDFEPNDRILLLGENGSGKSSIIRALKGVFERSVYLTYERSDLADSCSIEVSLFYQNKLYEITKGDTWKFVIDGNEQNYNNKTEFERDIPQKLPFVQYLDLFFITSNVQNLSAQFNPERRIDLISKFYRLDKINAYNQTAINLTNEVNDKLIEKRNTLNTECGIRDHINKQLAELVEVKDYDHIQLIQEKSNYINLRASYQLWKTYCDKLSCLITAKDTAYKNWTDALNRSKEDPDIIAKELKTLNEKLQKVRDQIIKNTELGKDYVTTVTEKDKSEKLGAQLHAEIEKIQAGVCPECGAMLSEGNSRVILEKKKYELQKCRDLWIKLDDHLSTVHANIEGKSTYINLVATLNGQIPKLQSEIQSKTNFYNNVVLAKKECEVLHNSYDAAVKAIEDFIQTKPAEVVLPDNLSDLEFENAQKLERWDHYQNLTKQIEDQNSKIAELESEIKVYVNKIEKLNQYCELTSITGEVYEEILKRLAASFSTASFKYEAVSWVERNRRKLAFNSYYFTKGKYRVYETLSDGQKTVSDIDFLDKLFSVNTGLLVLDEHLKHLDEDKFQDAAEVLNRMKVNTLIVSTHDPNYSQFTRRLLLWLNDEGATQYKIY